jgi:hypothetical protein
MRATERTAVTTDKPWLLYSIAGVWIAVAAATLLSSALVSYVGAISAPYRDEWYFTNPDVYLRSLFSKYNGHPFAIGRISLALDYWLFDARGWALRAATFLVAAGEVWAIAVLARVSGMRSLGGQIITCAFALIAVYNAQSYENFTVGFQFTFVLAFASTAGAISGLAAYAIRPRLWVLVLSSMLGLIASQSLGNGLITPLLLLLMAVRLELPRSIVAAFAALTCGSWASYLLMPGLPTAPINFEHAPHMIAFALRVLGSAPANTLGSLYAGDHEFDTMSWALIFGVAGVLGAVGFGVAALIAKRPNPGRVGAAAIATFALAAAGMMGLLRSDFASQFALTSRYTVVSALLIVAIGVLVSSYFPQSNRKLGHAILFAGALVAALAPIAAVPLTDVVTNDQRARVAAQAALVVDVAIQTGSQALTGGYVPLNRTRRSAARLRAHQKWLFQDQWSRAIDERIDLSETNGRVCNGALVIQGQEQGFVTVGGLVDAVATRRGRIIIVVDSDGIMKGYGLVPRRRSDFIGHQETALDWVGFTRVRPQQRAAQLTAYLASTDRLLCQIGGPVGLRR